MDFQTQTIKAEKTITLTLKGRLDAASAPLFHAELEKILKEDMDTLIFQVEDLSYISSAGIRVLLFARQKLAQHISIHVAGAKQEVRSVLTQTGIHHALIIEGLKGKIGVLIEEHFDGIEYPRYLEYFSQRGYSVEFISHLWKQPALTFGSNPENNTIQYHVTVTKEIEDIDPNHYKGFILIGAYAMDRLRYEVAPKQGGPNMAPAVRFLRKIADNPKLKIGTICHSLWLYCASPELLRGKKVTCSHNIICDVQNAGGIIQYEGDHLAPVYIDGNLISCSHPKDLDLFMKTFIDEIEK